MSKAITQTGTQVIRNLLVSKQTEFAKALHKNIEPDLFVRAALTMIQETPELLECSPASLYSSLMKAAQLSLSPDGMLGQAYLVPFKGKAVLVIGYKGLRELALRTGKYKDVRARVVYEKDEFFIQYGSEEIIRHVPAEGERGGKRGCYAVAICQDGTALPEFMWAAEIEKHKKQYSKGWKKPDSMWQTAPEVAWQKTLIRRLCGRLQMSVGAQEALINEDRMERDLPLPQTDLDGIIDLSLVDDGGSPEPEPAGKPTGVEAVVEAVNKKNGGKDISREMMDLMVVIQEKFFEDAVSEEGAINAFQAVCVRLFKKKPDKIDELNMKELKEVWHYLTNP